MSKAGFLGLVASVLVIATSAVAQYVPAVPELDPSSAAMGIALLTGGFLVLNGRRRKR
jgi:hypothetical protein